jgi:hypothetical protein
MRVLFTLPNLHRCDSGAEIAFNLFPKELAKTGCAATLIVSGRALCAMICAVPQFC